MEQVTFTATEAHRSVANAAFDAMTADMMRTFAAHTGTDAAAASVAAAAVMVREVTGCDDETAARAAAEAQAARMVDAVNADPEGFGTFAREVWTEARRRHAAQV